MGWMVAISACFGCGRPFSYNPDLVPSIVVEGVRQPICGNCVELANPRRVANGLDPIEVLPGAYTEQEVD